VYFHTVIIIDEERGRLWQACMVGQKIQREILVSK